MAHLLHPIPRPAILVGDLNEQPNGVLGTHLGRQGFVDARQLGGQPFYPTCLSGGRGDQIWTDVMHGVHLVRYGMASVSELDCHLPEVSYLADHLPVWAQIEL